MDTTSLSTLKDCDNLREATAGDKQVLIHEDHRWLLPIAYEAQEQGILPRPCTIVMYDAHHDALVPNRIKDVRDVAASTLSTRSVIDLCDNVLSKSDDDWVVAGMELGIIKDAVIFGVHYNAKNEEREKYVDFRGKEHLIWMEYGLPGGELGYQGALSDHAKSGYLAEFWSALHWVSERGVFGFAKDAPAILLDVDLDCFTGETRNVNFTWPDEVWKSEFEKESDYFTTVGWTGRKFFVELMRRAGIITIAREAGCCGGEEICDKNLNGLERFAIGSSLEFK